MKWERNAQSISRLLREHPRPELQNEPPQVSLDPQSPNRFGVQTLSQGFFLHESTKTQGFFCETQGKFWQNSREISTKPKQIS